MKYTLTIVTRSGNVYTEEVEGTRGDAMCRAAEIKRDRNIKEVEIQLVSGS